MNNKFGLFVVVFLGTLVALTIIPSVIHDEKIQQFGYLCVILIALMGAGNLFKSDRSTPPAHPAHPAGGPRPFPGRRHP